jgi:hypothetical protein
MTSRYTKSAADFFDALTELAKPVIGLAIAAGLFYGSYRWWKYEEEANRRLIEEVKQEDPGKIAYYNGDDLYVVDVQHIDDADDNDRVYSLSDTPEHIFWSEDGNTLYYLVDDANFNPFDTIHRIDALDLATGKSRTVYNLRNSGLEDDDIELDHTYISGDSVHFKLNSGDWYSAALAGGAAKKRRGPPLEGQSRTIIALQAGTG